LYVQPEVIQLVMKFPVSLKPKSSSKSILWSYTNLLGSS
jgi:hypothetical protein